MFNLDLQLTYIKKHIPIHDMVLKIIIPILLNISRKIPYHFPMNFVQKISLIFTIIINFVMRNMMQLITGYFLFSFQISVMGFYTYFQHNNKKFRAIAIATALFLCLQPSGQPLRARLATSVNRI